MVVGIDWVSDERERKVGRESGGSKSVESLRHASNDDASRTTSKSTKFVLKGKRSSQKIQMELTMILISTRTFPNRGYIRIRFVKE